MKILRVIVAAAVLSVLALLSHSMVIASLTKDSCC